MARNGKAYSNTYAIFAGCMITSCGSVDVLVYSITRRRLLQAAGVEAEYQHSVPSAAVSMQSGLESCKDGPG